MENLKFEGVEQIACMPEKNQYCLHDTIFAQCVIF